MVAEPAKRGWKFKVDVAFTGHAYRRDGNRTTREREIKNNYKVFGGQ